MPRMSQRRLKHFEGDGAIDVLAAAVVVSSGRAGWQMRDLDAVLHDVNQAAWVRRVDPDLEIFVRDDGRVGHTCFQVLPLMMLMTVERETP